MIETAESLNLLRFLEPLALVLGAALVGFIVDRVVLALLHLWTRRTSWRADEIVVDILRNRIVLWAILLGIFLATTLYAPVGARFVPLVRRTVLVIFVISITLASIRAAIALVNSYGAASDERSSALTIVVNIIRIIAFSIALAIIFDILGVPVAPAVAALGVGGLAISLALQETLTNIISGILIILSRQIRPGNYVRLSSGQEGYVADINWRNTQIRELPNNLIIVPNSMMTSTILTNYYDPNKELAILIDVGVSYDSDLEFVERVTIEVAKEIMQQVPGGVAEFDPFIRYNNFGDFFINFTVILRGKEFVDQYMIKHEFVKRLHKRYRQEGIEIPFPIRTLHTQGNNHALVATLRQDEQNVQE
jgi:small-conductance mechanosensitive channel